MRLGQIPKIVQQWNIHFFVENCHNVYMVHCLEDLENFRRLVPKYQAHLIDFDTHYTPILVSKI